MTANQEMIMAFLNNSTIASAKQLFKSGAEEALIELYDHTFRLFRGSDNTINFEFIMNLGIPENKKPVTIPGFGDAVLDDRYRFFNTVGYYTFNKGIFDTKVEATILNFCEADHKLLAKQNNISTNIPIKYLTIYENAIIGAFSAEAKIHLQMLKNCIFQANQLFFNIILAYDGDPQIFLDKRHPINGDPCFSIFEKDKSMLSANSIYDKIYRNLRPLKIYSINKFI